MRRAFRGLYPWLRHWRTLAAVLLAQLVIASWVRVARVQWLSRPLPTVRHLARRAAAAPDERVAWAIEAVGRRLPGLSTCLVRALTADLFLSRPGAFGRIRIGVKRREDGALQSHAWFEHHGRVLVGGSCDADYVALMTLGGTGVERC